MAASSKISSGMKTVRKNRVQGGNDSDQIIYIYNSIPLIYIQISIPNPLKNFGLGEKHPPRSDGKKEGSSSSRFGRIVERSPGSIFRSRRAISFSKILTIKKKGIIISIPKKGARFVYVNYRRRIRRTCTCAI